MHANEENLKRFPVFYQSYEEKLESKVIEEIKESSTSDLIFKKVETSTPY